MSKTPVGHIAYTVSVPVEDHAAMQERAVKNDRSLAAETRRAIRDYLTTSREGKSK